ncbi:HAD family hydrolase [Streptomyces triticirhizae]|uniref:HAD-IB family hydrolase n=1 Tax=Streptomyces triticirhizae TaxID=2483353 RepID=A0A3M2KYD2_9ACTN|nr:HAD-IB family hydrolase [Streptomyces triticirhizae]RMI30482.1 HAD-IB family hydrolase [Streptomyces triticirhizae]
MTAPVAFCDVDETLIRVKSMFRFLEFYLARRGEPAATYERLMTGFRADAAGGVPRQEINRAYYRLYAGEDARRLAAAGRDWFAAECERGGFWVSATRRALAGHVAAGEPVVLVSGSFSACLDPVAEAVGATWAIGTRPVVRCGTLTGEVLVPVIGATKARVAHHAATVRGADLAACTAYGDHASDLDLLTAVGDPVVVGADPVLDSHASRLGWRRLPSDHAPAPAPAQLENA